MPQLPSGLTIVNDDSHHSAVNNKSPSNLEKQQHQDFKLPLEVMAFFKSYLQNFDGLNLTKLAVILKGIYKNMSANKIEVTLFWSTLFSYKLNLIAMNPFASLLMC